MSPGDVCPSATPRATRRPPPRRTFLAHFMPQRDAEYRWWQDQIDYSRIYMARHVASDIAGGTLLGTWSGSTSWSPEGRRARPGVVRGRAVEAGEPAGS